MTTTSGQDIVLDIVGLGFGPANIAIAGALTEHWQRKEDSSSDSMKNVLFIEKHKHFRWHPGMLLPNARMQISFMKDLATLRNPQSPYTFMSYLHSQGRLVSFINRGSTIPTRKEYSDYLTWAAKRVQEEGVNVLYGKEVVAIESATDDTISIKYRDVTSGEEIIIRSRNIILSPGGSPRIPESISNIANHPRVIHSSSYCLAIPKILETIASSSSRLKPIRVAVIGSGQSAAEVTMDLRSRLSAIPSSAGPHQVDMLIRKGSLKPSDDSPFANEIFDPEATNAWFSVSSRRIRERKFAEYKPTNYGVVNPHTLENLYEIIYGQRLNESISHRTGEALPQEALINIKPYTSINSIKVGTEDEYDSAKDLLLSTDTNNDHFASTLLIATHNTATHVATEETYDAIVYATGYVRSAWVDLLKSSNIGEHFGLNSLSADVRLVPAHEVRSSHSTSFSPSRSESGTSSPSIPSSVASTPPTSPEMSPEMGSLASEKLQGVQDVYISRNYRLLPVDFSSNNKDSPHFSPRIYVQGVEESTHGLSDTLLSVLGVRAGEVVGDLMM